MPPPAQRSPRRRPAPTAGGFTLIETLVAVVLVLVPGTALLQNVVASGGAYVRSRELHEATEAARAMADRIQSTPIDQVCGIWSPGGTEGPRFAVPGSGDATMTGTVKIVTDETATDSSLGVQLGMPRDLDGDGEATHTDVSTTATILPVLIQVTWKNGRFRLPVVMVR